MLNYNYVGTILQSQVRRLIVKLYSDHVYKAGILKQEQVVVSS